ncbi:MAG TPA: hypothetical protein VM889_03795 [Candidatus Thermoplasmatota archaeon]|nr:hypothetical protein [Candidatus Thermoplasmatota archaeon]
MLASCNNCANREGTACLLNLKPRAGDILCDKYAMSVAFRDQLLAKLREDLSVEISQAILKVKVERQAAGQGFAA